MTKHLYAVLALSLFENQMAASAELTTYRCSYERYSNREKIQEVEKPFELVFITDPTDPARKATLVGNQRSSEVKGFWSHTIIDGEVVPSQYYGQCKVQ